MNLADIRDGIAAELAAITGVRVEARRPDLINPPAGGLIIVDADTNYVDYLRAMSGGLAEVRYTLTVIAGRLSERSAQLRLDELLSAGVGETRSIYDALKPDDLPQTLGGVVDDLAIISATGPRAFDAGEVTYLAADVEVRVMVQRLHS